MVVDVAALEITLGHKFRDRELLERSLTHRSKAHEIVLQEIGRDPVACDNGQMEFLGDAILGFVVSECLVRRFGTAGEGRLSKLKAHLVSTSRLHEVAQQIRLGDFLILGRGEELTGGREKRALLADAVEALIAALYFDAGLEATRRFIEEHVVGGFDGSDELTGSVADYKTALQETAQTLKLPSPRYVIVGEEGPEHLKTFTVEVRLGKELVSQAQGLSKKAAGQKAAQQILQQLNEQGRLAKV
jgi:ribonuclease III